MADNESILSPAESPNDAFIPSYESNLPLLPKADVNQSALVTSTLPSESASPESPQRDFTADSSQPTNETVDQAEEEDGEEEALMNAEHPLMQRVQAALYNQLKSYHEKLDLELRDKEEAVKKSVKKREQIGVEMYSVQQQLARLQAMLEGAQDNFGVIKNLRDEAERSLKHYSELHEKKFDKMSQQNKNLENHKQELEKISRTIKQVDIYSEDLRSKILVAKRTTLKAEDDLIHQELEKKRQDYFIDHLTEQLRKLQEKRALYETQLLAQQKETKSATETLHDASTEMEAIQFEKRQLLHQWKSSLIGLQKRDDILRQIESGITKNEETIASMECELSGFKRSVKKSQEESETLMILLNKLENEIDYVRKQTMIINDQKEKLKETYQMYTKSLEQAERDLQKINNEKQAIESEIAAVQKLSVKTCSSNQKLEREIAESLQAQLAAHKGALGSKKDGAKLRALIHEKESLLATTQNELSTNRIETLELKSRLEYLGEQSKKIESDCIAKSNLIEKYEMEMKRRHDELGKKASELDILNKKFVLLTSGEKNQESVGPLEATIRNMTNAMKMKEKECTQSSHYWLKAQNELVVLAKKMSENSEEMQDLKMKQAILSRKKMVVNNAFETEEKEIKEHTNNIRKLQNEMVKINILLSKQSNIQSQLEEGNLELEQEFRAKLKSAELESLRMETKISELKSDKEKALGALVESERQIMLWEKKIQLAKETQAALDPNIGATEIKEMTLEIHRMKLRLASMLKLQEKMISEMERAVYRRESIATKGKLRGKHQGPGSLQKTIADLGKKIKQTLGDIQECDKDVKTLEDSKQVIQNQIQEATHSCKELEDRAYELTRDAEDKIVKKQLFMNETLLHQRHQKRYRELEQGKYSAADQESRSNEYSKAYDRLMRIQNVLGLIQKDVKEPIQNHLILISNFVQANIEKIN